MKIVTIVNDISVVEPVKKVVCSCGNYTDKTSADAAVTMASQHIRRKHGKGLIKVDGKNIRID